MLTFVIPVRHQSTVKDWSLARNLLSVTMHSIAAQTVNEWDAVIIANDGADLPELPSKFSVTRVSFPPAILSNKQEERYRQIRIDKGQRLMAGLIDRRPTGHVMVVDYDDLVSNKLAALCARNENSNGWFFNDGYLYSGKDSKFHLKSRFHKTCGTSHIINSNLLNIPLQFEDAKEEYYARWLGSHVFIKDDLDVMQKSLTKLPFPGAIYRIGHTNATSRSSELEWHVARLAGKDPEAKKRLLSELTPLGDDIVEEFFGKRL